MRTRRAVPVVSGVPGTSSRPSASASVAKPKASSMLSSVVGSVTSASGTRAIGQRRVGLQLLQRPDRGHPAAVQQHQMVSQPLDLGDVVADRQEAPLCSAGRQ